MARRHHLLHLRPRPHAEPVRLRHHQPATTRKVTEFDEYDVLWPSLAPRTAIVFMNGGWLYRHDLASGETAAKIPVTHRQRSARRRCRAGRIGQTTTWRRRAPISPDGKRAVFEARGDLYSGAGQKDGRNPQHVRGTPGRARKRSPAWSPDGRLDRLITPMPEWRDGSSMLRSHDGKGEPRQLTRGRHPGLALSGQSGAPTRTSRSPSATASSTAPRSSTVDSEEPDNVADTGTAAATSTPTAGRPTAAGSPTRRRHPETAAAEHWRSTRSTIREPVSILGDGLDLRLQPGLQRMAASYPLLPQQSRLQPGTSPTSSSTTSTTTRRGSSPRR